MKALLICLTLLTLIGCQDDTPPKLTTGDETLKAQLRGVWLPTQLQIKYQVGITPAQRDTVITLTPTTSPLLVTNRANVIMPFTDTLFIGTVATARVDTFFTRNRGLRQQGNYLLTTGADDGASMLRVARPTYTRGILTRWNYDFVFHGTVLPGAQSLPVFSYTTYANYPLTLREVSANRLVVSFQTTGSIGNLPQVAVTPATQNLNSTWASRIGLVTATFTKQP